MASKNTRNLVLTALFVALGLCLPFLTGQIPEIGSKLLPMHLPVILCGFVCGGGWGLLAGFITPLLRSLLFHMPYMYPTAIAMAFELATYGLVSGIVYSLLPKKKSSVIISLLTAMVAGRVIWGIVRYVLTFVGGSTFSMQLFIAGAVLDAIPGIILQIIIIPILVFALESRNLTLKKDR